MDLGILAKFEGVVFDIFNVHSSDETSGEGGSGDAVDGWEIFYSEV